MANSAEQQRLCFEMHIHLVDVHTNFELLKHKFSSVQQRVRELEAETGQKQMIIGDLEKELSTSRLS